MKKYIIVLAMLLLTFPLLAQNKLGFNFGSGGSDFDIDLTYAFGGAEETAFYLGLNSFTLGSNGFGMQPGMSYMFKGLDFGVTEGTLLLRPGGEIYVPFLLGDNGYVLIYPAFAGRLEYTFGSIPFDTYLKASVGPSIRLASNSSIGFSFNVSWAFRWVF